jgi:hypothetical protein
MPKKILETPALPENRKQILPFVAVFVFIGLIFLAFFWFDFRNNKNKPTVTPAAPTAFDEKDVAPAGLGQQLEITKSSGSAITEIANKVSKHILLPSGDVTVLTVSDPELFLKENPTFTFLKKGDFVLKYADRAIFYDPVADLVEDVVHFTPQPEQKNK